MLHNAIPQRRLKAGELKDCLGITLVKRMNCGGTACVFSHRFWAANLTYTNQLAVVRGNRLSHLFSDEITGNPQAAEGRPHIRLFFNPFSIQ